MEREPSLGLEDVDDNLYSKLGVSVTATRQDIRKAYKRLAKEWHPDRHSGDDGAKHIFQQITRAYHVLTDPAAREQHDLKFCCLDQLNFQEFLQRYFYFLFSPQGLGLEVSREQRQQRGLEEWINALVERSLRFSQPISAL